MNRQRGLVSSRMLQKMIRKLGSELLTIYLAVDDFFAVGPVKIDQLSSPPGALVEALTLDRDR